MKQEPLNELQLELLKMFAYPTSQQQLVEIKVMLSDYFAHQADKALMDFWDTPAQETQQIQNWGEGHLRTKYNRPV